MLYQGANKTDLELANRAASIVRNTVPNYSYVSDFVLKVYVDHHLGNFVSFPAEIIRTSHEHRTTRT